MTESTDEQYDLAFSFAGEQRDYVRATAEACKKLGIEVFYDKDKNNEWWGKNYIRAQRSVYSSKTRYFVPFISAEYLAKPVPMDEFEAAMMTAVKQGDGYVLPVLMDDSSIPPELIHPHIHYLRASDYSPEDLAEQLRQKVQTAASQGQAPEDIGTVVKRALQVRLPKVTPDNWSKYGELDRIFGYLGQQFQAGAEQLRAKGVIANVRVSDNKISVRAERQGQTVAGIDIEKGGQLSDDQITWSEGVRSGLSSGFNGWATPKFNVSLSEP